MIEEFLDFENRLGLYDINYKGFFYWNYFRTALFKDIEAFVNKNGEEFSSTKIKIKSIAHILKSLLFNPSYSNNMMNKNYDILFLCHPRRVLIDGFYHSIYTDSFIDAFSNTLTVERPYLASHYTPAYSSNIYYIDRFFYERELKLRFRKNESLMNDRQVREIMYYVSREINNIFDYHVDCDLLIKKINYFYNRYCISKDFFNTLLIKTKPKCIIEAVYYNFENMVINECSRELGIPIVEMQHGLTGRGHVAYNFATNKDISILPNYFFAFSNYWIDTMRLPKCVKLESIGFDYYEKMLSSYPPKKSRNSIVFLSSGSIGYDLSKLALELLNKTKNFNIIYKLHPGEYETWKSRYPYLINTDIEVIDTPSVNLYDIFSHCIAQVSVYSTALYEGFGYELKTFIMSNKNQNHVEDLINLNMCKVIKCADDIIEELNIKTIRTENISGYFWEKNARENFINSINNIIK